MSLKFLFYRSLDTIKNIYKKEDESYNGMLVESIKRLPQELQYEILWILADFQLRKLEIEFRDIIYSKYFLKERVKYIFKIASEEGQNEKERYFGEIKTWFNSSAGLAIPIVALPCIRFKPVEDLLKLN